MNCFTTTFHYSSVAGLELAAHLNGTVKYRAKEAEINMSVIGHHTALASKHIACSQACALFFLEIEAKSGATQSASLKASHVPPPTSV